MSGPSSEETAGRAGGAPGGMELRLERGGACVAFPARPLAAGVELTGLTLAVPGARLPFDVAAGAAQFRDRACHLDRLEVAVGAEALAALAAGLALEGSGLGRLCLAPRSGFLEGSGALSDGTPFTFRALVAAGDGATVALRPCDPRLYAVSQTPAAALPALLARALSPGGAAGPGGAIALDPLPELARRAVAAHGFAPPRTGGVRLARAEVAPGTLRLGWARSAALPAPADPGLAGAGPCAAHPARLLALAQEQTARGAPAAASQALAEAAALAARRGEEASALLAAEAALALGAAGDPAAQAAAAETALRLRRDHLAALRALVALGERRGDRGALLRACRRLAAYAPDAEEKGAAHARLAALLAADPPAARAHADHALRLARSPALLRAVARTCDAAGEHLRAARARARAAPLDPAALGALAARADPAAAPPAEARRRALLARTARALAAFAAGEAPAEDARPRDVPWSVREAALHGASRGALPRLLALLAPWLEPLAGDGAASPELGDPPPALAALAAEAQRALGARACRLRVRGGDDLEVELARTSPPALVVGGGVGRGAPPAARFLLARGAALVEQGWAAAAGLGHDGRAALCALACRFAGAAATRPALAGAQAEALLAALARSVPAEVRARAAALAGRAAAELAQTPQPHLAAAARRSASRLALLHAGAPGAALAALVASERPLRERPRADALAHGDVRDLAAFALSDVFLGFRAEEG